MQDIIISSHEAKLIKKDNWSLTFLNAEMQLSRRRKMSRVLFLA